MLSLPPKGSSSKKLGSYFAPLKVVAQALPNMTVKISEGTFWTSTNEHMEYIGGTSPTIAAPTSDAKWVLVTVKSTGLLNIVDGTASGTPVLPDSSTYKDELPLAAVFIGDTTTAITNDMIYDLRPLWTIPPDSISQAQIDGLATITYVDNADLLKADNDGTSEQNFNLDSTDVFSDSGIYVGLISNNNSSNPGIRFNETASIGSPPVVTALWEFTNDGSTWNPIGVASGSYYTKVDLDSGALDFLYYTKNELNPLLPAVGVLDSRFYEQGLADTTFALISHTHTVGDIIGLSDPVNTINGISPTAGNVNLGLDELLDVTISGSTAGAVIRYDGSVYRNTILNIDDLGDVAISLPAVKDALMWNGSTFLNRPLVKADISDFLSTEFVLVTNVAGDAPAGDGPPDSNGTTQDVYGVKTFKDGVIIETSLTVTGSDTSIETTELRVTDPYIDLNFGEVGPGVGGGTGVAGIRIDRGPVGSPNLPAAIMQWDEGTQQWEFGTEGNSNPVLTGAHTHTSVQITDFAIAVTAQLNINSLNEMLDVGYLSFPPSSGEYLRFGIGKWENKDFATDITTELNVNNLNQLQDVVYLGSPVLSSGDFLQWNGTAWENHIAVKADISDFIETDYLHTDSSAEVKTGSLIVEGAFEIGTNLVGTNLTVWGGAGTITKIKSDFLEIKDNVIRINTGESGVGVSGGTAGIEIDRGPSATNAQLWWSEPAGTWLAHRSNILGSPPSPVLVTGQISFVGHQHVVADMSDLSVSSTEINTLTGITGNVQTQLGDKISRTGDIMDNNADLSFVNGEVLGLPALPSVNDAAASKLYVDTQDAAVSLSLSTHISDLSVHITANQNTFLDALNLPTLTAAEVNQLVGVTSLVQTQLDNKPDRVTPAIDQSVALLDNPTGNLVDSGVIINDLGSTINDLWTASKVDTTKADKVSPVVANNIATLGASGNLLDSGLALDDANNTVNDVWSANKIDTTKADKVTGATVGNFAGLDGGGNLTDSGVNNATYAPLVHTHLYPDVTNFGAGVTAELPNNSIDLLSDVITAGSNPSDFLRFDGSNWQNIAASGITEFVRATGNITEAVTGAKTFSAASSFQSTVTITGTLTANGTTNITGDLTASGFIHGVENTMVVNSGSTVTATADGGGIVLQRDVVTPLPDALLTWHHTDSRWQAGLSGSVEHIALENVTVAQPEYEIVVGTGAAGYNLGFGVSTPPAGRTGIQVFVNGIKQIEGATKAYQVSYANPAQTVVTFNGGSEPAVLSDVEFYGFGFIG